MDVRCSENMIMMALFGLLEREEDREAMDRMMKGGCQEGWGGLGLTQPRGGGYTAYMKMPGTWLNIRFHGGEKNSEQISIIPFRDGDDVRYFVVRGVSEGDRRVTRCNMVRIIDWDQLIDCGEAGVDGMVTISAGFREVGEEGRKLEEEIKRIQQRYGMRILGPNCFGFIKPHIGLNATFFSKMPEPSRRGS